MNLVLSVPARLACTDIYDPITPGAFTKIYRVGDTVCGTVTIAGIFYIVLQGTENWAGWIADAEVELVSDPALGRLHGGFHKNLPALMALLVPELPMRGPVVVTGHSKGAGEAIQLAALLHGKHTWVDRVVLFACPNAGDHQFATWVGENLDAVSYRNAPKYLPFMGDPVPLVPVEPYVPPVKHTCIYSPPAGWKYLIGAEWHMADLYRKAFV